eukprot:CAMPEP_0119547838 /NCGR_PEP_ID=MMETSP1352-20130426/1873_1 /TAXON_ID=265584 /ORGANISM="Stauroneis constricta, Strain CCMP1120" /LENGTH=511 /DNA_ID=CAMNT_0007592893 /DNA_START=218 /DNA_END=1753 /DNA_ORIENTATION=+
MTTKRSIGCIATPLLAVLLLLVRVNLSTGFHALSPPTAPRPLFRYGVDSSSLNYRPLEQDDVAAESGVLRKVQERTPPGFDVGSTIKDADETAKEVAATKDNKKEPDSPTNLPRLNRKPTAMNLLLIQALVFNQQLILGLGTVLTMAVLFFSDGFSSFFNYQNIMGWSGTNGVPMLGIGNDFLFGALAALPIIAFGKLVENSDNRDLANLNFSTITMVMTLFGRRTVPPATFLPTPLKDKTNFLPATTNVQAFVESLRLGVITGICEETVFRSQIPGLVHRFAPVPDETMPWLLPLVASSVLFSLGHAQPGASNVSSKENAAVLMLQLINGLSFGAVYILSGGHLAAAIAAHAIYDTFVLYETWQSSNAQVEYAEQKATDLIESKEAQSGMDQIWNNLGLPNLAGGNHAGPAAASHALQSSAVPSITRLFYTFDFDKNESLSKSEVRKGLSYFALEHGGTVPPQAKIDSLFHKYAHMEDAGHGKQTERMSLENFYKLYNEQIQASPALTKK